MSNNQPTLEQAFASVRICQMLSNSYRSIDVFRYDSYNQLIYILAISRTGELEVAILPNGNLEFLE